MQKVKRCKILSRPTVCVCAFILVVYMVQIHCSASLFLALFLACCRNLCGCSTTLFCLCTLINWERGRVREREKEREQDESENVE